MSQAAPTAVKTRRQWPRWIVWTGWTLLGLLLGVLAVTLATLQFGGVHGVELNPHTFARRSYSLYEIPLVRWQVRGIRREDVTNITVDFLETNQYVAAAKGAPDVWHVVTLTHGVSGASVGDAEILVDYLDAQDSEDYHRWVKWSEQNAPLAKEFWPAVSRLAQDELYVYIPDLFELAQAATDPVVFRSQLDRQLAERLFDLGRQLQAADDHAAAKKYLDEAMQLDSTNPLIKRAQEKSSALAPAATSPATGTTTKSKTAKP